MAPALPIDFCGQRGHTKCLEMMGKTRKVSKGHSYGFVPDYRHAVESMAESEGFGSSIRVDTEMAASENSFTPKRKCVSLNGGDSLDRFGVPVQVIPVSRMSYVERRDLELRLKNELEHIRIFQKRIASASSSVRLSPSSDIRSCSAGQSRPMPQTSMKHAQVPPQNGKKRPSHGRNGVARSKTPAPVRTSQVLPHTSSNAPVMKQCELLLKRLLGHQFGWVFKAPVDVVELNIPDYFNVIKHPMDLGTVKSKLTAGEYADPWGFAADVRLTFSNALTYNPPGNDVHIMAETLSKFFEARWKNMEKKLPASADTRYPSKSNAIVENNISTPIPPSKRSKTQSLGNDMKQEPKMRVISDVEKHKLSSELEALITELPENIIEFLKESSLNGNQTAEDEIEIDIDTLNDNTLLTLRKLLDEYMEDKQKKLARIEPGISNSSVQPSKVANSHPIEVDVDIGGNDLPVSNPPAVEIEKDNAARNGKCSSSSSSSGETDSSSSDSDSGSSSGSESDGAKASVCPNTATVNLAPEADIGQNKPEVAPTIDNCTLNGSIQVEQKSRPNPISVEMDGHQDEEIAPSKRQVSPEKLYRAAYLRSRFADTIIKAQEKTIGKDEKKDPEKLRLEKDELERRRREEKARLQAEAKAAEEAKRNAEAQVAAESKRKRELEREAARLALQKMEKTVEINENCRFLEDLEMLGVAPSETLPRFIDEASPDHSQDVFGSFKFQGNSTALQQLGLFMKDDYEEEDEVAELPSFPPGADDPEEGEID